MKALKALLKKLQEFQKKYPADDKVSMFFLIQMIEEVIEEEESVGKYRSIMKDRLKNLGRTLGLVLFMLWFSSCTKENISPSKQIEQKLLGIWKPISGTVQYRGITTITYPAELYWTTINFPYVIKGDSLIGRPSYHFVTTSTTLNLDRVSRDSTYHLYYQR